MDRFLQVLSGIFLFLIGQVNAFAQSSDTSYYLFPNTPENSTLFDQHNPFGLAFACGELLRQPLGYTFKEFNVDGISESDKQLILKHQSGKSLEDLGFTSHYGPQANTPLANRYGEDSVNYLPDGTTEYVYPARKVIWTDLQSFDEYVIHVVTRKVGEELKLIPEKVSIRKKYPGIDDPITILSFHWKLLYGARKDWWSEASAAESESLLQQLERYQQQQFQLYETKTEFLYIRYFAGDFIRNSLEIKRLYDDEDWYQYVSEWYQEPFRQSETVFYPFVKEVKMNLMTIYGEDSVVNIRGEQTPVYTTRFDTLIACAGPFYKLYEKHDLLYEPGVGWTEQLLDLSATQLSTKGKELVYFIASDEKKRSPDYRKINPLSEWLDAQSLRYHKQFDWEQMITNPKFKKERILPPNSPIR